MLMQCPLCGYDHKLNARFCSRCGARSPAVPGRLTHGIVFANRYKISRIISRNSEHAIYLVDDLKLEGQQLALKEWAFPGLSISERQQMIELFQQEARMQTALRHPGLCNTIDYFNEGDIQYLVLEIAPNETLEHYLEDQPGPLSEAQVIHYGLQICDVYLYSQQFFYVICDIKPGNIIRLADDSVKLIGFDLTNKQKQFDGKRSHAMGTPGYAPPEKFREKPIDVRSDLYSLGVTLHTLLTKYDPIESPFCLPHASSLNAQVSRKLDQIILQATRLVPEERFGNCGEMKAALRAAIPPSNQFVSGIETTA